MRVLFVLLVLLLASVSIASAQSQRLLPGYHWYGDSTTVIDPDNIVYRDSMSCTIFPYARLQWICPQEMSIDSIIVWCSIPEPLTEIAVTTENLTNTVYVVARLHGPLEYGPHAVPFQQPYHSTANYVGISSPTNKANGDWNMGPAYIDAVYVELNESSVKDGNPVATLPPIEFYDVLGRRVKPSKIYRDLGHGRALVPIPEN